MNIRDYNREAWDRSVDQGNRWTVPVTPEAIAAARRGEWEIVLTPQKPVPRAWFGESLVGRDVLCLASAGGQQGPILAAAGAKVTVYDNSPKQLQQDAMVAAREGLTIRTIEGDMRELSAFADASFDLIFHPVSNCFVPDILPVWRESFRVLRPKGTLLAGFTQPILFCFDPELETKGVLTLKYSVPYSDVTSLTEEERQRYVDKGEPLCFGHSLEDQIGGQIEAGFVIAGFFEDKSAPEQTADKYFSGFMATRALKP